MNTLILILLIVAVYLIYAFVSPAAGLAALAALVAAMIFVKWPLILMLRGNSRYNKGDRDGGLALMEKAYKTGKLEGNMVVFYSYCLMRENKTERAMELLDEYIASGKGAKADLCRAKHNKAVMLWKAGNLDEAFDLMKEVHGEMPATDTYGTLGLIYIDKAKAETSLKDEALEFLKEAYDYNSDDRTIADNLGNMYFETGMTDEAEEVFKKLLSAKQSSPTPYYRYAKVLMAKENYEDAEDMLNRALRCSFSGVTAIKRVEVTDALALVDAKLEERKGDN